MQAKFFADDGTEFKSASECRAYERELYEKAVNEVPLEQRANKVIEVFECASDRKELDDEYLDSVGKPTRYSGDLPLWGDYSYGVLYLRDDAVRTLVSRVRDLERRLEDALRQFSDVSVALENAEKELKRVKKAKKTAAKK
jgi:hypothetical protein